MLLTLWLLLHIVAGVCHGHVVLGFNQRKNLEHKRRKNEDRVRNNCRF